MSLTLKYYSKRHSRLDLAVISGYSLIYTWTGSYKAAMPIMLTGHLDVVPRLVISVKLL